MLLRTYAWMNLLSDNGIINHLLGLLGISPVTMMYTNFSVVVGMVCNFMPFMIIPIHTSLRKMDNSLIEAAMDLGANPFQTFQKVVLKLSMPGVINGIVMVFLMAISSFVIPKLLGGGQFVLIGNLIESQFVSVGDWNFGSAISLILANAVFFASSACFGNGKSACMISSIALSFLLFFSLSKSNFFAIITSSLSCTYRYTSCCYRSYSHISILVFRKLFCYTCEFSVFLFFLLQSLLLNIIFC